MLFSLPVAAGLLVFGQRFLLIFGAEFTTGRAALSILSAGQLINVAMGAVGLLLVMTGHERDAAKGIGIGALLNIILNALMIPRWGLEGAAIANAGSIIAWNVLLALWVYRRLGIDATAFGPVNVRRVL